MFFYETKVNVVNASNSNANKGNRNKTPFYKWQTAIKIKLHDQSEVFFSMCFGKGMGYDVSETKNKQHLCFDTGSICVSVTHPRV